MPKQCNYDSCRNNVFGGGFCKYHQWARYRHEEYETKLPNGLSKPTRHKKDRGLFKPSSGDESKGTSGLFEQDKQLYYTIWECREHECFNCGRSLPSEPLTLYFHHVLEKRNFPDFRHVEWNIVILCPDCHHSFESYPNPKKFSKLIELTKELKEKYV